MNVKTILTLVLFFSFAACSSDKKDPTKDGETPIIKVFNYQNFELQAGDLLFQDGDCGDFCEAIENEIRRCRTGTGISKRGALKRAIPKANYFKDRP